MSATTTVPLTLAIRDAARPLTGSAADYDWARPVTGRTSLTGSGLGSPAGSSRKRGQLDRSGYRLPREGGSGGCSTGALSVFLFRRLREDTQTYGYPACSG